MSFYKEKVICKLSVFRITGTWQPGKSGICCLSSEKTKCMFEHKQSSSFDKVCSDQSIDALRPFFSRCKLVSLHACRHHRGRSKPPRCGCLAALALKGETRARRWDGGRRNPSAVGLIGLATTWSPEKSGNSYGV